MDSQTNWRFPRRINRIQFWIGLAITICAVAALAQIWPRSVNFSFVAPWLLLHGLRMRDFGMRGLWTIVFVTVWLFAASGLAMFAPVGDEVNAGAWASVALLLAAVAFTVWVGAVKGSPDLNRFGPPPARLKPFAS